MTVLDTDLRAGLGSLTGEDLARAQREVARLLEDDNVTYTPSPAAKVSVVEGLPAGPQPELAEPRPWRLDPVPLVLDEREWAGVEAGVVQRAELLDAVLADLYGPRRLLASGDLPTASVFDHAEYLRPLVGAETLATQPLFLVAADLGRDATGGWQVLADRTQAPSGAGYAMQNRRVVSRVLPELYQATPLHRLTPFFQAMRTALVDAAPPTVEDPRVVVLTPGPHSETAFDQAFLASLLGFPLVEGSDLTVREGRLWLRALEGLEPVDVVLRRVDAAWTDPLELRAGSRLGAAGLVGCVRRGTVTVVNSLGAGVLENPALMPFLPRLSERLLGQPLRLPSVPTWWCGDPSSRSHVLTRLDELIIRPTSRAAGRGVLGAALTAEQRSRLVARIEAAPHRFVGQEVLRPSAAAAPAAAARPAQDVVLRSFAVRSGSSYTPMLGGLARVSGRTDGSAGPFVTVPDGALARDVWVVGGEPTPTSRVAVPRRAASLAGGGGAAATPMVPRVLADLFWCGRYAERAEDLLRLLLAARTLAVETSAEGAHGAALDTVRRAVTHVSTTYPGLLDPRAELLPELRALLLDRHRAGTVAQSLAALSFAAQGVRDQLSEDVWMVLADVERALAALAGNPHDRGLQLTEVAERVLTGLLALSGIVSENMVRDPRWHLLDSGRRLERALQVVALLRATTVRVHDGEADRLVREAVLAASESVVTYRRRYRGLGGTAELLELLVVDQHNPRAVAYQLARLQDDLRVLPDTFPTARPLRLLDPLAARVRTADPDALAVVDGRGRPALARFLDELHDQLRDLSEAIRAQYLQQPTQQLLTGGSGPEEVAGQA